MKTVTVLLFFIAALLAKECLVGNKINDLNFDVNNITIAPGDSIRWVLSNGHNVAEVIADGVLAFDQLAGCPRFCFRSGNPVGLVDFRVTFPDPGTHFVICERHVFIGMKMTIIVDATAPTACFPSPLPSPPPSTTRINNETIGGIVGGISAFILVAIVLALGASCVLSKRNRATQHVPLGVFRKNQKTQVAHQAEIGML